MTATIRVLERLRQQGEFVDPVQTFTLVKNARKEIRSARLTGLPEDAHLVEDYYRTTAGPLSIDFFIDTSAVAGPRRDEEFVEFLDLLGSFRAELPEGVRCRLWSLARLRPRDLAYLLLLGLRVPEKSLLIPISHGVPDARFHTFNGQLRRLHNESLHRLFRFQDRHMHGVPRNDLCEGSCYHLARVSNWAALTRGTIFHTSSSAYLLTRHIFDLAKLWARENAVIPADFSLRSSAGVPYWFPRGVDGSSQTDVFEVTWTQTGGRWR